MKVLREDVRQRILNAAREEFLLRGYAGASMRAIARRAGMTVGNIYLYFDGKDGLFEATVGGTVAAIDRLTRMQGGLEESVRELVRTLHDVFIGGRTEFMILITRADGSRFQALKDTIIGVARQRMAELLTGEDAALSGPLAVAVIEGLLDIFNRFDGDEERLTAELLRFLNYMLRGLDPARRTEAIPCED